jgi:PadR family transcriptional regulator PadR
VTSPVTGHLRIPDSVPPVRAPRMKPMSRLIDVQRLARTRHEILILGALRDGPMHGYRIARVIEVKTRGGIGIASGTLYPILRQLEQEALIHGLWDGGHGRRRRRIYVLASGGRTHLRNRAAEWRALEAHLVALVPEETSGCSCSGVDC